MVIVTVVDSPSDLIGNIGSDKVAMVACKNQLISSKPEFMKPEPLTVGPPPLHSEANRGR